MRVAIKLSHPLIFAAKTKALPSHNAPQRRSATPAAALCSTKGLLLASK
jgi:hypothetical protein